MKRFYKLYQDVLKNDKLTRTQQQIISVLINRAEYHQYNKFYCYEEWIAQEVNCSVKTVKRAIKYFAELELIDITKVYNKVTKKTTNYYVVNIDTLNNKVVEETEVVVSDTLNKVEEEQTAERSETVCVPVVNSTPKTEEQVNNEEIVTNVKEYLKKSANKNRMGTVYFPEIMKKYKYTYKEIVEAVKELDRRGSITYKPSESDGKLYHSFTINTLTINDWRKLCKKVWGESNGNQEYLQTISKYSQKFINDGISEEELVNTMIDIRRKVA